MFFVKYDSLDLAQILSDDEQYNCEMCDIMKQDDEADDEASESDYDEDSDNEFAEDSDDDFAESSDDEFAESDSDGEFYEDSDIDFDEMDDDEFWAMVDEYLDDALYWELKRENWEEFVHHGMSGHSDHPPRWDELMCMFKSVSTKSISMSFYNYNHGKCLCNNTIWTI